VTFRRAFTTAGRRTAALLLQTVDLNGKHGALMRGGARPRRDRRVQRGEANA